MKGETSFEGKTFIAADDIKEGDEVIFGIDGFVYKFDIENYYNFEWFED